MTFSGTERRRQLVTAGIGTALTLVMGAVLIMGFRLATHMRASINALQTASALQTYPEEISHQLNSLRDRLEVRAYSGQALADLQGTVHALRPGPEAAQRPSASATRRSSTRRCCCGTSTAR